ncbi:MAG TPA: PDZ domain-containing protein [Solirubrobacteraceae bacterium]|nr:PDZ domain-containing protein [Solirubrobacteraceae bacterium]
MAAPHPRRRTLRDRMRALAAHVRTALRRIRNVPVGTRRQRRIALVAVAATLLLAGAAYAVTSAVVGGGSGNQTPPVVSKSGAWLGIDVASTNQGGVMVVDVFPGSPAQAAGMEPGDVITQIDGHQILTPKDVRTAIAGKHPGDQVQLQFQGSGTSYTASVPLASPPAGYP